MTPQQEAQRQQEELLAQAFENWKLNPVTQLLHRRLVELRESHINKAISNSGNPAIEDKQFRIDAHAAKTVEVAIKMMTDVNFLVPKQQ